MNVSTYEKPAMKFVSLRSEEKIADTCWGYHGTDTILFADIDGPGFCSFQIGGGSCALNLINVQYYQNVGEKPNRATDEQVTSLRNVLAKAAGAQGNSFKGESAVVKPNPDSEWS